MKWLFKKKFNDKKFNDKKFNRNIIDLWCKNERTVLRRFNIFGRKVFIGFYYKDGNKEFVWAIFPKGTKGININYSKIGGSPHMSCHGGLERIK